LSSEGILGIDACCFPDVKMAQKLPMELQMMLCNRAFGAANDTVLTKQSEPAFKRLGKLLAKEDSH